MDNRKKEFIKKCSLNYTIIYNNNNVKNRLCNFYIDIVLFTQSIYFDPKSLNLRGKNKNEKFLKNINFITKKNISIIQVSKTNLVMQKFNQLKNKNNFIIYLKYSSLNKYSSLLKRLRNAFCHNNFNFENNILYLKDYNFKTKKITMVGKMKITNFDKLLEILINHQKLNG